MKSRKMVRMNLFIEQQKRPRTDARRKRLAYTTGEDETGTTESSIEAYTLPCAKYIASKNLLYDARSST